MVGVNKAIKIPKLELYCSANICFTYDPAGFRNYSCTMSKIALMVVRKIQYKEIGKVKTVHGFQNEIWS